MKKLKQQKKIKQRKCKNPDCKKEFYPHKENPTQPVCFEYACIRWFLEQAKEKKRKSEKRKNKLALKAFNEENVRSKYWRNKADAAWSKVIHLMYSTCAVNSGDCAGNLEAHHLLSRVNIATRHMVENGILLCSSHHEFNFKLSAHLAPIAFSEWMMVNRLERWQWCSDNKNLKSDKPSYKKIYEDLKRIVDKKVTG